MGEVIGTPVTATIGATGGELSLPDGSAAITIPAGALAQNTTISIQAITNVAPNGLGNGIRLGPASLRFAVPATVRFAFDTTAADSLDPQGIGIARQDSTGSWSGYLSSVVSLGGSLPSVAQRVQPTVAAAIVPTSLVSTTVLRPGDIVRSTFWRFAPYTATLNVKGSVGLRVESCFADKPLPPPAAPGEEDLAPLINVGCGPTSRVATWLANNIEGGNSVSGTIVPGNSAATYTAPAAVPPLNPVFVTAKLFWAERNLTKTFTSRITIQDNNWRGTMTWKSSGGLSFPYTNGSLEITYLAEGSARYSSASEPFGTVTALGGVIPAVDITTTYYLKRVETSHTDGPPCIVDVTTTYVTDGGLNGPPPQPLLSSIWNVTMAVTSPTTYQLNGGPTLIPVKTIKTETTRRDCVSAAPVTTTTVDTTFDYAGAARIAGPTTELWPFTPGDPHLRGRIDATTTVQDVKEYPITSYVTWDFVRP